MKEKGVDRLLLKQMIGVAGAAAKWQGKHDLGDGDLLTYATQKLDALLLA